VKIRSSRWRDLPLWNSTPDRSRTVAMVAAALSSIDSARAYSVEYGRPALMYFRLS